MRVKSLIEQRLKQLELKGYTLENYFNIIHSDKNALFSEYKNNKVTYGECETYSKDQLEDLAESFETLYDIDEKDLKAAKRFHVKIVYDNDGEKTIDYVTVTVVKVGKKWSIYRGLI